MNKLTKDKFSPDGIPDAETWEHYRGIIGGLKWEWKTGAADQEPTNAAQEMGDYTFHISRTTDTGALILPEGSSLDSIVKILEWLTTDDPKKPNKPQILNIDSEAGVTIRVSCKKSDIASQLGFSMDANKSEKPAANFALKIDLPSNPLYDAMFYRSGDDSNKLYCFVPQPISPIEVRRELKIAGIKFLEGQKNMTMGIRSGMRLEIDESKKPSPSDLLKEMNILILGGSAEVAEHFRTSGVTPNKRVIS